MTQSKKKQATAAKPSPWARFGVPGPENLDPVPMEMPFNACRPTPLHELIARSVRLYVEEQKEDAQETWDEANDFDMPDDEELDFGPYELKELEPEDLPSAELAANPQPEDEARAPASPAPAGDDVEGGGNPPENA